jgi:MFS superfamily sulfate permease-like transporter
MYGMIYLIIGFFFSHGFDEVIKVFPLPVLGIILLFEGLALMSFIKDIADSKGDLFVAMLVAVIALTMPQGYLIGLIVGMIVAYFMKSRWYGRSSDSRSG